MSIVCVSLSSGSILKKNKTVELRKLGNASLWPEQGVTPQGAVWVCWAGLAVGATAFASLDSFGWLWRPVLSNVFFPYKISSGIDYDSC